MLLDLLDSSMLSSHVYVDVYAFNYNYRAACVSFSVRWLCHMHA